MNGGDNPKSCSEICSLVQRHSQDFLDSLRQPAKEKLKKSVKWKPASGNFLKINIDGSFSESSRSGGWGFVIRNTDHVVGAGAGNIPVVSDPLHSEAEACLQALSFPTDAGMGRIEIETDVISRLGFLETWCSVYFLDFRISHCPRACNQVAHELANLVVIWNRQSFCCGMIRCVSSLVAGDCAEASVYWNSHFHY